MAKQTPLLPLQSNFIAENIFIIPCLVAGERYFFSFDYVSYNIMTAFSKS